MASDIDTLFARAVKLGFTAMEVEQMDGKKGANKFEASLYVGGGTGSSVCGYGKTAYDAIKNAVERTEESV